MAAASSAAVYRRRVKGTSDIRHQIENAVVAATLVRRLLPLSQLELDATVATIGLLGLSRVERLELAEAGGDQMLRRNALADEILHHRDGARRRQRPVRGELRSGDRAHVGMAVDAQDPGDVGRDLLLEVGERTCKFVDLDAAFRPQDR